MNCYILQYERKLCDDIKENGIAYAFFELQGFFLGGYHAEKTEHHPESSPGAD
jgi:hypothetical protein